MKYYEVMVVWWCSGLRVGRVIKRSRVRLPVDTLSDNNSAQVANTHVPLSPSSTIWYRPKGGDALQPRRWVWRRTGHASQTLVVYPPTGSRPWKGR